MGSDRNQRERMSHKIATKEHADGRKDVTISVNKLDIEPKDKATAEAKEIIEKKVLPKLAETPVLVVVVHKPTNQGAHKVVPLKHVRAFAEAAIRKFVGSDDIPVDDFVIVEHHLENGKVQVSTL